MSPADITAIADTAAVADPVSTVATLETAAMPVTQTKPASATVAGERDALVTVRYQVADIDRATTFYAEYLGFRAAERSGAAFGSVVRGSLRLILSGPGSSGSRPMPDGRRQEPGGWNRIVLYVDELAARIRALEDAGVRFRNQVEVGPGGSQILIEDPDGNPIELHEPPS
jgi:glyoxylase I family protein